MTHWHSDGGVREPVLSDRFHGIIDYSVTYHMWIHAISSSFLLRIICGYMPSHQVFCYVSYVDTRHLIKCSVTYHMWIHAISSSVLLRIICGYMPSHQVFCYESYVDTCHLIKWSVTNHMWIHAISSSVFLMKSYISTE